MKKRETQKAKEEERRPRNLYEIDYLLGVHDFHRMGALRFKLEFDGDFLDNENILHEIRERGIEPKLIGALDEYGANGERLGEYIRNLNPDFALIAGVPHAIPPEYTKGIEIISITNGPRQVEPLKAIGHQHVIVEVDLHPKTLGVRNIVESEFGAVLRSMK